jgi:hypothetical protein
MLSGNENRPAGKSDQRKRKAKDEGKKPAPRKGKAAQQPVPQPDQLHQVPEVISTPVTSTASSSTEATASKGSSVVPVASGEIAPFSYRTIANAYRNCFWQSLDQTSSFFERLGGVRSLDKAFELQTEFAKQAYQGFVAKSQTIHQLHNELARQRLKIWEGLVVRMINPR